MRRPARPGSPRRSHAGCRQGHDETGRHRDNDPEAREILEVVGDVGVDERENNKKLPRAGNSVPAKISAPASGVMSDDAAAHSPKSTTSSGKHAGVLPAIGSIHMPARIDEAEVGGPKEFAEVKPQHASGQQGALQQRQIVGGALRADVAALHPRGAEARGDADREPGQQREATSTPPREPAALPPRASTSSAAGSVTVTGLWSGPRGRRGRWRVRSCAMPARCWSTPPWRGHAAA